MASRVFTTASISTMEELRNQVWMRNGQQVPPIFRATSMMGFHLDLDHSTPDKIHLVRVGVPGGISVNPQTGLFSCMVKGKNRSGDVFDLANLFPEYFIHNYQKAKEDFETAYKNDPKKDQSKLSQAWYVRVFSLQAYRWFQIIAARELMTKVELRVSTFLATYDESKKQQVETKPAQETNTAKVNFAQNTPSQSVQKAGINGCKKQYKEYNSEPIREFLHRVLPDSDLRIETWLKRMGFVQDLRKSSVNSHVYRAGDAKVIVMTDPYRCYNDRTRKGYLDIVSLSYDFPLEFSIAMGLTQEDPTKMWAKYGEKYDYNGVQKRAVEMKYGESLVEEDRLRFNKSRYTSTGTFYDPVTHQPYNNSMFNYLTRSRNIPQSIIQKMDGFMSIITDESNSVSRTGADAFGEFYGDYYWNAEQCQAFSDVFHDNNTLKRRDLKEDTRAKLEQKVEENMKVIEDGIQQIGENMTQKDKQKLPYLRQLMEKLSADRQWPIIGFPVVKIPKELKILSDSEADGQKVQRREYASTHPKTLADMELCGYEFKARGFKHNASNTNTSEGVWMACKVPFAEVRRVFFFESALDALSFIEVDRKTAEKTQQEPRFDFNKDMLVSVAGQFSAKQGHTVKTLVPQAEVYACFDIDPAGRRYAYELNKVMSKQAVRETKERVLVDAIEMPLSKIDTDFEKRMTDNSYRKVSTEVMKDSDGQTLLDEQGKPLRMARYEKYDMNLLVMIGDKEARLNMNDVSIFRVREQLPSYELALTVLQPEKAQFRDCDLKSEETQLKTVKDWNDRLACDKWEKKQQMRNWSGTAGRVRDIQAKKQQEIDDRINKANERIGQRTNQGRTI